MVRLLPARAGILPAGACREAEPISCQRSDLSRSSPVQWRAWLLSFIGDEVKGLERKVAGFEVINPTEFDIEYTFNCLNNIPEIQRRLEFLADRTLQVANRLSV